MTRRALLSSLIALLLMALPACSSPLDGDDADALPTPTEATPTPAPADTTAPAHTPTTASGDASGPPTATGEAEPSPAVTGSTRPATAADNRPTPPGEPLPEDGDELTIDGQHIIRIISGGDNGRTLYAIADERFWRSNDGGHTWSEAGRQGDWGPVIVASNQPNVLYSGDKGACGRGFSFFPFQRSTDAGRNWETVDGNADIQPLLAYEGQGSAFVYGTNCGLTVSADGGDSWQNIVELNGEEVFSVTTQRSDPMAQLLVVAATEGGTGRLFLFDLAAPGQPLFVGAIAQFWGDAAVDWFDGRIIIANAHQAGVSDDNGRNWQWTRAGLEDATYAQDPLFEGIPEGETDPFPGFDVARIDPTNRDHIWIGGSRGAYLSTDGGASWTLVGEDEPVTGLAISTVSDRVFISYASGTRLWSLSETGR